MLRELLRNRHAVVTLDDELSLVRIIRTEDPFERDEEIESLFAQVIEALPRTKRKNLLLLVDLRRAPARNDPKFEALQTLHRDAVFGGYRRAAVLVRTAAGALQLSRLGREANSPTSVFNDETKALAFLMRSR